ncbi:MAG: hypothetical protein HOV66_21900, partial [Streptomycetaceae bacterium]|nr:hypothetical protein [Streptomycetaceae bacterium]
PHEDDRAPRLDEPAVEALGAVLRDRMQQAVAGLEPQPGALDLLRRAVPARRRRRRAALATTAVTVFAVSAGATLAARGSLHSDQPKQAGSTDVGNLMSTGSNGVPGGGSGHGPGPVSGQQMSSALPSVTSAGTSATSLSETSKAPPVSSPPSSSAGSAPPPPSACQSSSVLRVFGTRNPPNGGVVYEAVIGTVKTACTLSGTPTLLVSGGVPQLKPDPHVVPQLAGLPAGRSMTLQPGDWFEFQYAWVPASCPAQPTPTSAPTSAATSSPTAPTALPTTPATSGATSATSTPTPTLPATPASSTPSPATTTSSYAVSFALSGTQVQQTETFAAACGATLYVSDYFPAEGQGPKARG